MSNRRPVSGSLGGPVLVAPQYRPEHIGATLREVDAAVFADRDSKYEFRWFHSDQEVDLFVWLDRRKNIVKQRLNYLGSLVEWNLLEGVRTGVLIEEEAASGEIVAEVEHFDEVASTELVRQACDLITHAIAVDSPLRAALCQYYQKSPRLETLSPEEFIMRFGSDRLVENFPRWSMPLVWFFIRLYQFFR